MHTQDTLVICSEEDNIESIASPMCDQFHQNAFIMIWGLPAMGHQTIIYLYYIFCEEGVNSLECTIRPFCIHDTYAIRILIHNSYSCGWFSDQMVQIPDMFW